MARKRITRTPLIAVDPPTVPPVNPPPPCDLSAFCAQIQELMTTLANAASGSMIVMGDDGHVVAVPPPVANARWCWNAATGQGYWQPE